jgi:hypothetical protein
MDRLDQSLKSSIESGDEGGRLKEEPVEESELDQRCDTHSLKRVYSVLGNFLIQLRVHPLPSYLSFGQLPHPLNRLLNSQERREERLTHLHNPYCSLSDRPG